MSHLISMHVADKLFKRKVIKNLDRIWPINSIITKVIKRYNRQLSFPFTKKTNKRWYGTIYYYHWTNYSLDHLLLTLRIMSLPYQFQIKTNKPNRKKNWLPLIFFVSKLTTQVFFENTINQNKCTMSLIFPNIEINR